MATTETSKSKKQKPRAKTLMRDYKGADSYLEKQSRIIHHLLESDKTELTAIDTGLNDPFSDVFDNAIKTAESETVTAIIRAQLKQSSSGVRSAMQLCRDKYNEVMYFAQLAFKKNKTILREFGIGSAYKKATHARYEMQAFLMQLNRTANNHSAELIANGYSQAKIDDILTVRDQWLNIHSTHNDFKIARPELTAKRIAEYNTVYELMMRVINAAKLAFKNNPAKLGEYVFRLVVKKRKKTEQ